MPSPAPHPRSDHAADGPGPTAEPRRILIVRLSHLGDVVHALPLYHRLAERWPAAELAWAIQPEYAALVEGLPRIARTILFDRRGGPLAWWRLRRALRAFAPDLTVDAQGNLKSAAVTLLSGAAARVGFDPVDWREPLGARALTARAGPAPGRHAVERVAHLAAFATGERRPVRLDPALSDVERRAGEERLAALVGPAPRPVVLQLGAPRDPRSWTGAGYALCAAQLRDAGRAVVVLSGPGEVDLATELRVRLPEEAGRLAHTTEDRGPRSTAALLAAVAARDGRFVGADSGPVHLAAAVGLRSVLLAGPQDPRRTGPYPVASGPGDVAPDELDLSGTGLWGSGFPSAPAEGEERPEAGVLEPAPPTHRVVWSRTPVACSPCLRRRCDHPRGPICMQGIEPRQVVEALSNG